MRHLLNHTLIALTVDDCTVLLNALATLEPNDEHGRQSKRRLINKLTERREALAVNLSRKTLSKFLNGDDT